MSIKKSELREWINELVWTINSRDEQAVTASQVADTINARGNDVSPRTVRQELKELHEKGELRRRQGQSDSPGRPPMLYYHPDHEEELFGDGQTANDEDDESDNTVPAEDVVDAGDDAEIESTVDREQGEREVEDKENESAPSEFPLMGQIRQEHLGRSEYADEIRAVAPDLAQEDPSELLLEMAEWLVNEIDRLGQEVNEAYNAGELRDFEELENELEGLVRFAGWYFQRIFRIDYDDETGDEILYTPSPDEMYEDGTDYENLPSPSLDRERAADRLGQRIVGDRVIEAWDCGPASSAAGADSSVASIGIPNRNNPMLRKTVIDLFTGAAALNHESRSYTDYDFETTSLRRYRRRDAFIEGLMISPSIRGLKDGERDKARYAALDLRLYNEINRILENDAKWRPIGSRDDVGQSLSHPDVVFSDGRVTPLVHQLSDYAATGLYGELARNEMEEFANMVARLDSNPLVDSTLAGVVKRTNLTWLAPLVFYYLEEHADDGSDREDDTVAREIYQPPINDPVVAHLLYDGLAQAEGDWSATVFVSFRVQRRFYDYSLNRDRDFPVRTKQTGEYINTDEQDDWVQYFEEFVADRQERGYDTIDADEFDTFAYLCANASTAMCYAAPTQIYEAEGEKTPLMLPRIEVAAVGDDDVRDDLEGALGWYAAHFDFDDAHAVEERSTLEEAPVLVPEVIKESDEAAKFLRGHIGKTFEKEFRRYVQDARELAERRDR